eukprot:1179802-Prorocentrum_minimum.AAC.7
MECFFDGGSFGISGRVRGSLVRGGRVGQFEPTVFERCNYKRGSESLVADKGDCYCSYLEVCQRVSAYGSVVQCVCALQ